MTPDAIELTAGNVSLRGQRWAGDPLTLLLLHEPGDEHDLDDWRPLIPFLLGNGATTIAVDLRGHGASDGDWTPDLAVSDLAACIGAARRQAELVVVCAAGDSAVHAIRASETTTVDGLILLSPADPGATPPRGAGAPKLIVVGAGDAVARDSAARLRRVSIGAVLTMTVPSAERGAALLAGELAATCREQILMFLNERRREPRGGPTAPVAPDRFLERLGIRPKGADA
jgi:pimeloyl-ACP methyl ester carboxylesterase